MSSQRGNTQRTRPQKYRNTKAFKNNLHDTSKEVKQLSDVPLDLLCPRCVEIIQWRVKFKKYHQLTNPKACVKCNEKTVKQAYHIVCKPCSSALKICCKCGKPNESINFEDTERQEDTDQKFIDALKNVRERERRTLLRLAHSNQSTTEVGSTITDKEKPSSLMDGANELIVEKLSKMNCNWKDEYETDDYESS